MHPTRPPSSARPRRSAVPPCWSGPVGAALGASASRAAYHVLTRALRGASERSGGRRWYRTNFRGEQVNLLEGPAVAFGAAVGALLTPGTPPRLRAAAALAAGGAGACGAYDDLYGSGASRGFKGHLGALARGEITTGAVKLFGIGASGLTAAVLLRRPSASLVDVAVDSALIAGSANLLNLFDLRPGRAAKVGLLVGLPALAGPVSGAVAGPAFGAASALIGEDLGERAMLGDSGANALGAALGTAAAAALPRTARMGALAAVAGLTAASEFVSFTSVIAATPPLRRLDEMGRRPAPQRPDSALRLPERGGERV